MTIVGVGASDGTTSFIGEGAGGVEGTDPAGAAGAKGDAGDDGNAGDRGVELGTRVADGAAGAATFDGTSSVVTERACAAAAGDAEFVLARADCAA